MIYLTSYVPSDTVRVLCGVLLVFLTISCCNLGEIHGFQGKDEEIAKPFKLQQIRKKDTPKKPTSSAERRIHAVENVMLPSIGGVQSTARRGDVPAIRIDRGNRRPAMREMYRLQNRPVPTVGRALHARGQSMAGKLLHHTHLPTGRPAGRSDACRQTLPEIHEAAKERLRAARDPVLPMWRIRRAMFELRVKPTKLHMRKIRANAGASALPRDTVQSGLCR